MIESPLIQDLIAERTYHYLVTVLETRFGTIPLELVTALRAVTDEKKLSELFRLATSCSDLAAFQSQFAP